MSARLLRARTLVQGDGLPVLDDGAVLVEGGRIAAVGPYGGLRSAAGGSDVEEVDGILLPGFVDAHSHLRGIPLAEHGIPPRPLEPWLCSLAGMTPLPAGDEAFVAAIDALGTGITAVQAIVHSFAAADEYGAEARAVGDALRRAGIRALVVMGYSDRAERAPDPADAVWAPIPAVAHELGPDGFAGLAAAWLADPAPARDAIRAGVGPVASQWVTDEALAAIVRVASGARVHTHLNESAAQRDWIAGDAAPLARLDAAGLVGPTLSAAHAVHLTDDELDRVAAAGASLVHCPESNVRLQVGRARVAEWLERGIDAGLGVDSQNDGPADMFSVMRAALDTAARRDRPIGADRVLAMATSGGGRCLGEPGLGLIRPGAPADLVALDLALPPGSSFASAAEGIVADGRREAVRTVLVAGRTVLRDGETHLDATAEAAALRALLAADAEARAARNRALEPAIEAAAVGARLLAERGVAR